MWSKSNRTWSNHGGRAIFDDAIYEKKEKKKKKERKEVSFHFRTRSITSIAIRHLVSFSESVDMKLTLVAGKDWNWFTPVIVEVISGCDKLGKKKGVFKLVTILANLELVQIRSL